MNWRVATALALVVLLLPAMIFMNLYAPRLRPVFEFIAALPFVVPAIALVAGLSALFTGPGWLIGSPFYPGHSRISSSRCPTPTARSTSGLRALDLTTLTEAGQSLGAGMGQIIRLVVLPNLRSALVGSLLLTLAVVIGEFTFANVLLFRTFAVLMNQIGQHEATEAAALVDGQLPHHLGRDARRAGGRPRAGANRGSALTATVAAREVRKSYAGRSVLARLDLDMAEGELVCLLGPSGCGKTTLLRIIAGFVTPDSGRVIVGGAGRNLARRQARVGWAWCSRPTACSPT